MSFLERSVDNIRVSAEQRRLDQQAAFQLERQREMLAQEQRASAEYKKTARAAARRQARARLSSRIQRLVPTVGRRTLIVGPILAPMAVAWVGQIGFATDTLGWRLAGALVFAASWELTTAFAGWMYHQARQDGDAGTLFRFATWLFAASAGAMNYWHALGNNAITDPTPKAVSYGAMSLVGIGLWELYASLIHRKALRDAEKLPPARPKFGMARWLRFPGLTFRAWSQAIKFGLATTDEAWTSAFSDHDGQVRNREFKVFGVQVFTVQIHEPPVQASEPDVPNPAVQVHDATVRNHLATVPVPTFRTASNDLWWLNRRPEPEPDVLEPTVQNPRVRVRVPICSGTTGLLRVEATRTAEVVPAAQPAPAPKAKNPAQPSNLGNRAVQKKEQVQEVLNLIKEEGFDNVGLPQVQNLFGTAVKKTTAYSRLVEARANWNLNGGSEPDVETRTGS